MQTKLEACRAWLKAREKPEISIRYERAQQPMPVGASKIGGCPDVPAGFDWPYFDTSHLWCPGDGIIKRLHQFIRLFRPAHKEEKKKEPVLYPLTFLAQFDLAEVAAFDTEGLLPRAGHLAFFYDCFHQPGYTPDDGDCARVFYFPPGTVLQRTEPPAALYEKCRLPEYRLVFSRGTSRAPSIVRMPEDDGEIIDKIIDEYYGGGPEGWDDFKLLGNANAIQNGDAMDEQCQLYSMGLDWDDATTPQQKEAIKAGTPDWMLLLQFGSIFEGKKTVMMFGDSGALYYWIRRQDLAACRFDDVRVIMECC